MDLIKTSLINPLWVHLLREISNDFRGLATLLLELFNDQNVRWFKAIKSERVKHSGVHLSGSIRSHLCPISSCNGHSLAIVIANTSLSANQARNNLPISILHFPNVVSHLTQWRWEWRCLFRFRLTLSYWVQEWESCSIEEFSPEIDRSRCSWSLVFSIPYLAIAFWFLIWPGKGPVPLIRDLWPASTAFRGLRHGVYTTIGQGKDEGSGQKQRHKATDQNDWHDGQYTSVIYLLSHNS